MRREGPDSHCGKGSLRGGKMEEGIDILDEVMRQGNGEEKEELISSS